MSAVPPGAVRRARLLPPLLFAMFAVVLFVAYAAVALMRPAQAAPVLVSQGRPTVASSQENAGTPPSAAVDGSTTTRWSSQFSDPQWIYVDLGSSIAVSQVILRWEAAYATAYQLQMSNNTTTWTTIYSTTTSTGGVQTINATGTGRYVRMYGTARATGYGYSLWEFQVYGEQPTGGCSTSNAAQGRPVTAS